MSKVKWSDVEKQLDYLDQPELIEVLRDLFNSSDTVRAFLANRFLPQGDRGGKIELLLTYVESGTRFTNDYGDINESFYSSLESALGEMADLLKTPEGVRLYPQFQKRIEALAR